MAFNRRAFLIAAIAVSGLAACRGAPVPPPSAPIDFTAYSPIVLDVASIDVVDQHRPVAGAIDAGAPVPVAEAAKRWVAQRLRAGGKAGRARVTILEASVTEEKLKTTDGIRGYFTNDQSARYNGRLSLEIAADRPGDAATVRANTRATATASATVAKESSIAEREAALQDVIHALGEGINARLDTGVRKDMAALVLR